jgi:hypothetical protein
MIFKYILLFVLGTYSLSEIYRQAYELYFYWKTAWDFSVDSRYSQTTYNSDGPQTEYIQTNRHRVLLGRPALILGGVWSFLATLLLF